MIAEPAPATPSKSPQFTKTAHPAGDDDHFVVDSSIAHDGGLLHYRLEGNPSPTSPILVFINDILVNLHIWDPAVKLLKERYSEHRFLRYDIREYTSESLSDHKITLSTLAIDLSALFSHLQISIVHCLIGLGLGANIALAYLGQPEKEKYAKVSSFVGISFPLSGSPFLTETAIREKWDARITLANKWGMGITADKAVVRWFSVDARGTPDWVNVREMVAARGIEGMAKVSDAIVESVSSGRGFDGRGVLGGLSIPSLFLTGSEDSVFPEEMENYPAATTAGLGRFMIIDRASRLAIYEKAEDFTHVLGDWLANVGIA